MSTAQSTLVVSMSYEVFTVTKVELKSAPDIRRVVLSAFPSYRKHNAYISVFGEHGKTINSYWDGGSRDEYAVVELSTGKRHALPTQSHPYFNIVRNGAANTEDANVSVDHVGNVTLKHLPEGFVLVQAGTSCGKPATAHLYVPPENMAKLLGSEL